MRLPIVPAWFPLRALALQGVMALCVLLFCLARSGMLHGSSKRTSKDSKPGYRCGNPPAAYGGAQGPARGNPAAFSERPKPCRRRTPCRSSSPRAGNGQPVREQSSHFVPAAETVVEKNRIRLDGTLSGPPDNFRRLVLLLSEQPWLSGMEFLNGHPFRRASRILAGDLGHVHATGQHAAALMKG